MITDEQNARSKRLSPYQPVNRYTGTLNDPFMQAQSNYMGPEWGQYFGALQKIEEDAKDAGHNYRVDWSGFGNTTSEQESGMPRRRGTLADLSGRLSDADAGRQFDADVMDARVGQLGLAAMQRQEQAQKDAIAQADIDRQRQDYEQFKVASAFQPPMGDTTIQRTARPGQSELITGRPNIAATPADPRKVLETQIQRLPANHPIRLDMEKRLVAQDAAEAKAKAEMAKASDEPLVAVMGPDGQSVLVPRSQASGKRPASSREQGRPVTAGNAEDLADYDTSIDELSAVRAAISPEDSTGIVAQIGAKIPYVTQITGWGTDAKKRQAVIDRVKQVIGKTLEGGVLRKEDEAKYEKILPTIGDAPAVAAEKLNGLESAINKRKARRLDALDDAGYDVGSFRQRGGGGDIIYARDPDGNIHQGKRGTPLPPGWQETNAPGGAR